MASLLIDLSAWARSSHPSASARWKDLVEGDELACHPVFALELLHNSINPEDHQRLRNDLEAAFDWVWPDDDTARLALRLQQRMAMSTSSKSAPGPKDDIAVTDAVVVAHAEVLSERRGVSILTSDPGDLNLLVHLTNRRNISVIQIDGV